MTWGDGFGESRDVELPDGTHAVEYDDEPGVLYTEGGVGGESHVAMDISDQIDTEGTPDWYGDPYRDRKWEDIYRDPRFPGVTFRDPGFGYDYVRMQGKSGTQVPVKAPVPLPKPAPVSIVGRPGMPELGTAQPYQYQGGGSPYNFLPYNRTLIVNPMAVAEAPIAEAVRQAMAELGRALNWDEINGIVRQIGTGMGLTDGQMQNIARKLLGAGASALVMATTGNFPLAAMAYFSVDRALDPNVGKAVFTGAKVDSAYLNDLPLMRGGIPVPSGLPNDVFDAYRFVCFDRLSETWWPTDEVMPLAYQGVNFRWLCLDRVDGKIYHANFIKKPKIYL